MVSEFVRCGQIFTETTHNMLIKLTNWAFGMFHSFIPLPVLKFQFVAWGLPVTSKGFWFSVVHDQFGDG